VIIRTEQPVDAAAIHDVVSTAFHRSDEARLVDQLRSDGDAVLSLVAVDGGEIIGYALFSRMIAPFRALGLGPVAVRPHQQRTGIGGRLIRAGLDRARQGGWRAVFVLGDPGYYRRFGFDPALAGGFACRYSGPHFMALPLGHELPVLTAAIDYAPAFLMLN
jgi:putative acetyltransferase